MPNEKAGAASGIYKMASSLGAAFGAAVALLFNVMMVIVAIVAIATTVPRDDPRGSGSASRDLNTIRARCYEGEHWN